LIFQKRQKRRKKSKGLEKAGGWVICFVGEYIGLDGREGVEDTEGEGFFGFSNEGA